MRSTLSLEGTMNEFYALAVIALAAWLAWAFFSMTDPAP